VREKMKTEEIKKIACIGAGIIGHSWACAFAQRGYDVRIMDINQKELSAIPEKIRSNFRVFIQKGLWTFDELEKALGRLEIGNEISWAVDEADFCIESVPEDLSLKQHVYAQMDKYAPKTSILASSTSGQSITEISRATKRPDKCIVIHPLNPPHIIPAVEVVRGERTSDETTTITVALLRNIGKKPFVCMKEVPGFVMSRLILVLLREALSLVKNGVVTIKDIDMAISDGIGLRFGLMGIFQIVNLTCAGGLEMYLRQYGGFLQHVWSDFEDLREITPDLIEKVSIGMRDESGDKSTNEYIRWRDENLLELMKIRNLI
jgi:carnitine 3-dehydrogenase